MAGKPGEQGGLKTKADDERSSSTIGKTVGCIAWLAEMAMAGKPGEQPLGPSVVIATGRALSLCSVHRESSPDARRLPGGVVGFFDADAPRGEL
jgi:hypothetical protein